MADVSLLFLSNVYVIFATTGQSRLSKVVIKQLVHLVVAARWEGDVFLSRLAR